MINVIAIALVLLWFLGLVSGYTLGGLVHGLLLIAVVLLLARNFSRASAGW